MLTDPIVHLIDAQIAQLQEARAALADIENAPRKPVKRVGRPKGSGNKTVEVNGPASTKTARRTMSAEGKARIVAAQKKRWAAQKKAQKPVPRTATKSASQPKPTKKKRAAPTKKGTLPGLQPTTETTTTDA